MPGTCDHCGHRFLYGEPRVESKSGDEVYCNGACRYDAEVLEEGA